MQTKYLVRTHVDTQEARLGRASCLVTRHTLSDAFETINEHITITTSRGVVHHAVAMGSPGVYRVFTRSSIPGRHAMQTRRWGRPLYLYLLGDIAELSTTPPKRD